jgi:hypothetical protein
MTDLIDADFSMIDELNDPLKMTERNVLQHDDWMLPSRNALNN